MENIDKLTKAELIELVEQQEKQLIDFQATKAQNKELLKQNEEYLKTRNDAINAEYEIRKELERANTRAAKASKEKEYFKGELDALSDLFNEYVTAYKDQVAMTSIFVNNSKSIGQLMDGKIAVFNSRPKGPGKED